jgi:hypothetical protein
MKLNVFVWYSSSHERKPAIFNLRPAKVIENLIELETTKEEEPAGGCSHGHSWFPISGSPYGSKVGRLKT